jgi:hypothetical protein
MGQFSVEKPVAPGSVLSENQQLAIPCSHGLYKDARTTEIPIRDFRVQRVEKSTKYRLH